MLILVIVIVVCPPLTLATFSFVSESGSPVHVAEIYPSLRMTRNISGSVEEVNLKIGESVAAGPITERYLENAGF
jgi:hypothetical protein